MGMLKKSMILLKAAKVSICIFSVCVLASCGTYNSDQRLTSFPFKPDITIYDTAPVISYDKTNKTYIVTSPFVKNSVLNVIYIDEITKWKRDNGIR